MKLDKDSFDVIIGMTLLMVALISVVLFFIHNRYISWSLAGLFFVFLLFVIWFHRVPSRAPQGDEKSVLAVADGRVVIVEKAFDPKYGARPIRRKIQTALEDVMAEDILAGKIKSFDSVKAKIKKDEIVFEKC